mmetsp:Transcript_3400/g.11136  ORF Transcript_3400/g.11136 Transcript_3400/m.11136 type:complete len:261 (-) Transcript_3400:15-797(-)
MECQGCQGQGVKIQLRQIGPGMVQQMQSVCGDCRGSGKGVSASDKCTQCRANQVVQEKKVIELVVEKGMANNQKITFQGEGDEAPDIVPGDIVFVIQEKPHETFKRKGDDLFIKKDITLVEALCGFKFAVKHLDGRTLVISSEPGEVVKPDMFKAVEDEGMPNRTRPYMRGKLFVQFNIVFPEPGDIGDDQIVALGKILGRAKPVDVDMDNVEEVSMHTVNIEEELKRKASEARSHGREAYGSDDEDDEMGGQRVQCAQQ